ncbi:PPC domain-containing DNA-binding protein [uncultured Capnocytophaga sp.]|uniref:PPC domain-containing DNA-binding protein n=1 Tax=uncultured Capnocytophaga sp. TaxID=159273 RepID=UPI0028EAE233|nr:PPC domain-containing DNA-binding protein [uncultured Capnocytophaga sp.]
MYTYQAFGDRYVLSLENHVEITKAMTMFCEEKQIKAGVIHGIGAVGKATLRFFDPHTKQYIDKTFQEQMEIACLIGNISQKEGKPYLHLHIALGRSDYSALAGHLLEATLSGAGEFVIEAFEGSLERYYNTSIGLNLYQLRK